MQWHSLFSAAIFVCVFLIQIEIKSGCGLNWKFFFFLNTYYYYYYYYSFTSLWLFKYINLALFLKILTNYQPNFTTRILTSHLLRMNEWMILIEWMNEFISGNALFTFTLMNVVFFCPESFISDLSPHECKIAPTHLTFVGSCRITGLMHTTSLNQVPCDFSGKHPFKKLAPCLCICIHFSTYCWFIPFILYPYLML